MVITGARSSASGPSLLIIQNKYSFLASSKAGVPSESAGFRLPCTCVIERSATRCQAPPDELDTASVPRFREHTHQLWETFNRSTLYDVFGIVNDVRVSHSDCVQLISLPSSLTHFQPFTDYFPRADIHELLAPDLLHQLVKGTFKDHLVSWVEDYIRLSAPSARAAKRILDDIDRRYVCFTAPCRPRAHDIIASLLHQHSQVCVASRKGGTSSNGPGTTRRRS